MNLDPDQQRALDALLAGRNALVTGPAGTGKSVLLREFVRLSRERGAGVAVTASTGIAALQVGGSTVHSYLGTTFHSRRGTAEAALESGKLRYDWTRGRIVATDVLVVDEVSMLTGDYVDMTDWWMRYQRGEDAPFGGAQVVFVGDFMQLPPVIKPDERRHVRRRLAFQADAWADADVGRLDLGRNHRQEGDAEFRRHLSGARHGHVSDYFRGCVGRRLRSPVRLFATNARVDALNRRELAKLPGPERVFSAKFSPGCEERHRKMLARDCITSPRITLKPGARVILTRNDHDADFVNGDRGVVTGFGRAEAGVTVRLDRDGGRTVLAARARFERRNAMGKVLAWMRQVPVKLAWALTVHKSQGMSLPEIEFDPDGSFERGQVYTALSRAERGDGLRLTSELLPRHVLVDAEAAGFYARRVR